MAKPPLLIIIDNLAKGGAEIMLVELLPELNKFYKIILVTLSEKCEFEKEEIVCEHFYSLMFKNKLSLIPSVFRLKKIIRKHKPALIHSHLIYSSLIARISSPSSTPLIYSIHGELSKSDFNNSKVLTFLEKATIRQNHSLMAVSNVVLADYEKTISKTKKSFVLHNYISDEFLNQQIESKRVNNFQTLKLIAIGNIKAAKNYEYLLNAFTHLKGYPVSLDIYGNTNHHLYKDLQNKIEDLQLNVSFRGAINDVREKLNGYDLFIMSSKNEGFGISVIEAMASGLPALLSDIPVMREITLGNALFFDLHNPENLSNIIKKVLEGNQDLSDLSTKGIQISKQYCKQKYSEKLFEIYEQLISEPAR